VVGALIEVHRHLSRAMRPERQEALQVAYKAQRTDVVVVSPRCPSASS
jgi:hypothetical protein